MYLFESFCIYFNQKVLIYFLIIYLIHFNLMHKFIIYLFKYFF